MESVKKVFSDKKQLLVSLALVIGISIYPVMFMYCKNVAEVDFKEILPLLLLFSIVGMVMFAISIMLVRELNKSTLIAFAFVLLFSNYMLIQKGVMLLNGNLKYWHIMPICVVILLHISYFIKKRCNEKNLRDIVGILTIVVCALLLINLIPALPKMVEKSKNDSKVTENTIEVIDNQPNIYWMVFDECASFPTIEKYYKYEDKDTYNYLLESGFTISDDSRNESGNTHSVLTNCLNLEYVVNSDMDYAEIEQYRKNPLLFQLLKENGYNIRGIGETEWLGVNSLNYNSETGAQTVEGVGPNEIILQNTIIGPFVHYNGTKSAKLVLDTLTYFQKSENIQSNSSQFNFLYVNSPHQPFLFDEEGNAVKAINYNNWDDDRYYLGQYRFVMSQIEKTVNNILKYDSNAIIIIQSDHGPRFKDEIPYEDKINVLNAVYYQGKDMSEIDGKSDVNTLRTVLNRLFGYELEDLEVKDGEK